MKGKRVFAVALVLCLALLGACGGGGGGGGSSSGAVPSTNGAVNMHVTDAPAYGYDNVWVTLKDIWFHTSSGAGPDDPGWLKFPITPVTIDLLTLANGTISSALWQNIQLPAGTYQQIRIVLAGTDDSLTASASSQGLTYNNEVVVGGTGYPLRIADAVHGIRLAGTFTVSTTQPLSLAIDFDAGDDIVDVQRGTGGNTVTEYYLKPRLAYFDLSNAGAIVGTIDTTAEGQASSAEFVFKAEQVDASGRYYEMKRVTTWDSTNNRFVLYPLPPGNYDVILRGIGYETVIIKNVAVTKGTSPSSNPTVIPQVSMSAHIDTDVAVTAQGLSPTGGWLDFYQTIPGESVPHEIRFRHLNPFTGGFSAPSFPYYLSQGHIDWGTWIDNTTVIPLTQVTPSEGLGGFDVVLDALDYTRGAPYLLTPVAGAYAPLTQTQLAALLPATPYSVSGSIVLPNGLAGQLDSGKVIASHGGMITTVIDAASQMANGGAYAVPNLPGGFACAFYGIEAFGWSSATPMAKRAISVPTVVDLTSGNATNVDLTMIPLF